MFKGINVGNSHKRVYEKKLNTTLWYAIMDGVLVSKIIISEGNKFSFLPHFIRKL